MSRYVNSTPHSIEQYIFSSYTRNTFHRIGANCFQNSGKFAYSIIAVFADYSNQLITHSLKFSALKYQYLFTNNVFQYRMHIKKFQVLVYLHYDISDNNTGDQGMSLVCLPFQEKEVLSRLASIAHLISWS